MKSIPEFKRKTGLSKTNRVLKIAIMVLLLCSGSLLFADGENLTLKIAVVGPGDELYLWWGHIGLIVEDSNTGRSYFYDYGVFNFEDDNFFVNFAFGRLLYKCAVSNALRNIDFYERTNRNVVVYTLDLPPETRLKASSFAANNVIENPYYFYHHFEDNCSTRIRDIIDLAVDGQLKEQTQNKTSRFTLREHISRHSWFSPPADWFLNFLMGQVIDTPISVWEEMFLPAELGSALENFWYTDINGERRKLVSSAETVLTAKDRPPILDKPLIRWPHCLLFSLVLAAIFLFFFILQTKNIRAGRILSGISMSLCALVSGSFALLLYFMSIFTNHDYTYQNINMLFYTPLLLAAVPFGIGYAFTKKPKKLQTYSELLRLIWLLSAAGVIISILIKLLPWFYQDNLADQMIVLPIALVFTCNPAGLKETLNKYFPRKTQNPQKV